MIQGYRFVASEVNDLTGFPTDTKGNLLYGHVRENSLQCCPNVNNHEIDVFRIRFQSAEGERFVTIHPDCQLGLKAEAVLNSVL